MKKSGILNRELSEAIASMGHGHMLMITDAGLAIPMNAKRIDLAIAKDYPDVVSVLKHITGELIYERCIVAEEQKLYNPPVHKKIKDVIDRCAVEEIPHARILEEYLGKVDIFVRTGSFDPWSSLILVSGVDAPVWFSKEGVITPDFYTERANFKERGK